MKKKALSFFLSSLIIFPPLNSFFFNFNYRFSWSMYNGVWDYEYYKIYWKKDLKDSVYSRGEVIKIFDFPEYFHPYGLKYLKAMCDLDPDILQIQRMVIMPVDYTCTTND
jgi:hypothetical protein